jgi:nicotinate-nucleotide pyrophosphorylase (carboxylating)
MMGALLEKKLLDMVSEDMHFSDITTAFTPDKNVTAEIIARQEGIVSGIEELMILFKAFGIASVAKKKDGEKIKKDETIFALKGTSREILTVERTALNLLSRMSGISTLTKKYVDSAKKANSKIKVAATRKTTPLLAFFEKKAVKIGGGDTHRFSLEDEVLIKNNHLRMFKSVRDAVETAKKETSFAHKIEIEVGNKEDAVTASLVGADIILLDNMKPAEIKATVALLEAKKLRSRVLIEASGGINLENIAEYAKSGADVLSVGALTHSAQSLNINLRIK